MSNMWRIERIENIQIKITGVFLEKINIPTNLRIMIHINAYKNPYSCHEITWFQTIFLCLSILLFLNRKHFLWSMMIQCHKPKDWCRQLHKQSVSNNTSDNMMPKERFSFLLFHFQSTILCEPAINF